MGIWYSKPPALATKIPAFWETLSCNPLHPVAYLPARVLDRTRQPVNRPRPAERQQERAGLRDAQAFRPEGRIECDAPGVPGFAHESSRDPASPGR